MCRSKLSIVIFSIFLTAGTALAKDFKSPHKLEAGQTLSADVLNEIIESLSYSEKIPTRDDFLGTWNCKRFGMVREGEPVDYEYDFVIEQNIIRTYTGTVKFITDGKGGYFVNDQKPRVLMMDYCENDGGTYCSDFKINDEPYATIANLFLFSYKLDEYPSNPANGMLIKFNGANQFTLQPNTYGMITCNKTNIPPEIPEETTTTISGNSITLTWTDRSEDETGFAIVRRDKLDSQWNEIATVDPVVGVGSVVTYTNIGLSAGTYWYRVKSVNAHGKSLGSNVSKVEIP